MNVRQPIPLSEKFRVTAEEWVALDAAANILEECKSATLSQRMKALGEMPVNRAELEVKASEEWADYLTKMVKARESANLAKVRCEFLRMKFSERQSAEATARSERRL